MYCVKCGKELPDDASFCNKCGTAVKIKVPSNDTGVVHATNITDYTPNIETINNTVPLEDNNSLIVKCPICGYTGRMEFVGGNRRVNKIWVYVVGYGIAIIVGFILDVLLAHKISWWILFICGLIVFHVYTNFLQEYAEKISRQHVICPQCKKDLVINDKQ